MGSSGSHLSNKLTSTQGSLISAGRLLNLFQQLRSFRLLIIQERLGNTVIPPTCSVGLSKSSREQPSTNSLPIGSPHRLAFPIQGFTFRVRSWIGSQRPRSILRQGSAGQHSM